MSCDFTAEVKHRIPEAQNYRSLCRAPVNAQPQLTMLVHILVNNSAVFNRVRISEFFMAQRVALPCPGLKLVHIEVKNCAVLNRVRTPEFLWPEEMPLVRVAKCGKFAVRVRLEPSTRVLSFCALNVGPCSAWDGTKRCWWLRGEL